MTTPPVTTSPVTTHPMSTHRSALVLVLVSAAAGCLDTASLDNDHGSSGPLRAGIIPSSGSQATPARPAGNARPGTAPRAGTAATGNAAAGQGGSSSPGNSGNPPPTPADGSATGMAGAAGPAMSGPGTDGAMAGGAVAGSALAAGCLSYQPPANGMCGGYYCGVTEEIIAREATPNAKCSSTAAFKCEGRIVLVVGACARMLKSSMPFASNDELRPLIRDCVFEDAEIAQMVHAECLSCFIDAAQCAGDNCLIECLAGDSANCDACRIDNNCEQPVFPCTGLPNPF
jgi:hypothetical protein